MSLLSAKGLSATGMQRSNGNTASKISSLDVEIAKARHEAEAIKEAGDRSEQSTMGILKRLMEIQIYVNNDEHARTHLDALYKKEGIRTTKATPSQFTPLIKLVAGALPKETQSRSVAAVDYAMKNDVGPGQLAEFIAKEGGIVKCAKAARQLALPIKKQKFAEKRDEHLELLRRSAKPFSKEIVMENISPGIYAILIEKRNGTIEMLGHKFEKSIRDYDPLKEEKDLNFD